jgi:hypothetical protein
VVAVVLHQKQDLVLLIVGLEEHLIKIKSNKILKDTLTGLWMVHRKNSLFSRCKPIHDEKVNENDHVHMKSSCKRRKRRVLSPSVSPTKF